MSALPQKQPKKLEVDISGFEQGLSVFKPDLDKIKSTGIMIYDKDSLDEAVKVTRYASSVADKINGIFNPTKELLKAAEKSMKAAVEVFTKPIEKYVESNRDQIEKFMRDNPDVQADSARVQNSQWKLVVEDEDALFRSMISVNRKKIDGKMVDVIEIDPKIRSLFAYQPAKGNALAAAMTSATNLAGCKAEQGKMLVFSPDKEA